MCNLASIAVHRFYDAATGVYDHAGLHAAAKALTYNLNRVIDVNYYPTPETRRSNMDTRPIGIGVQVRETERCALRFACCSSH